MTVGTVAEPNLTNLRITDNWKGKSATLVVRSRASQLTTEEARVTPDMVIGMFSIYLRTSIIVITYVSCSNVYRRS